MNWVTFEYYLRSHFNVRAKVKHIFPPLKDTQHSETHFTHIIEHCHVHFFFLFCRNRWLLSFQDTAGVEVFFYVSNLIYKVWSTQIATDWSLIAFFRVGGLGRQSSFAVINQWDTSLYPRSQRTVRHQTAVSLYCLQQRKQLKIKSYRQNFINPEAWNQQNPMGVQKIRLRFFS